MEYPARAASICLAVGLLVGSVVARVPTALSGLAAVLSEIALVLSLFCVGLRLPLPVDAASALRVLRLTVSELLAALLLIAGCATVFFGLPFEQALVLGAVLAPTDPALAPDLRRSAPQELQAAHAELSAVGALGGVLGLPLILFALAACGHYDPGSFGLHWLLVDVLWALLCGFALGWWIGGLAARVLRALEWQGRLGVLELLALASVIALTYGGALALHANGFSAALAAGGAIAAACRTRSPLGRVRSARALARLAPRVERACALVMAGVLGLLAAGVEMHATFFMFALLVLIALKLIGTRLAVLQLRPKEPTRALVAGFGVRGIASIYYLLYASGAGLDTAFTSALRTLALAVVATSIILQALSLLPLADEPVDQKGLR
jgi:sodium/hydrogen antiporter